MSKMLEQAIVDAEALREAALKNAEQNIIEKYSEEVKTAVQSLLEQPEDEAGMTDIGDAEVDVAADFADVPRADTDGENLCACPEEGGKVTIDLDAIAADLDNQMQDPEALAGEIEAGLEDEDEEEDEEEIDLNLSLQEDVDLDIPEELIAQIMEKVTLNLNPVPSGTPGGGTNTTRERYLEDALKARLAVDATEWEDGSDAVETNPYDAEELRHAVQLASTEKLELEEQIKTLTAKKDEIIENNNNLTSLLSKIKVKLEEVNLTNAQLYYTNKVLGSTSLNERQKSKIVESLSSTSSVEETKVIYDTLQSAVGQETKSKPQSLSEAVSRPSTTIPRREEKPVKDTVSNRWKTLAGINKS